MKNSPVYASSIALLLSIVSSHAQTLLSEDFEGDLSEWSGKHGETHHALIVDDPVMPSSNHALTFTALNSGGDIFSKSISSFAGPIEFSFDYLGLPQGGSVPDDFGGFLGYSTALVLEEGITGHWLAGTLLGYRETLHLIDDGQWRHYKTVVDGSTLTSFLVVIEDYSGSGGVVRDVYFDNIRVAVGGNHFMWSPISSPQEAGVPIPVTLTARSYDGDILTSFTNSARLSGYAPGLASTNLPVGAGTGSWGYPMYTYYHDARTQVIYPASELAGACTINSLAIEVATPPGQTLENWTIRMKHTALAEYPVSPSWDGSGWAVVYQGNELPGTIGWRTFEFSMPFEYNGTNNLLVDFSFNNAYYSSAGQCRCTANAAYRSIYFWTDSAYGDPLTWSDTTPAPVRSQIVPNIVLGTTLPGLLPVPVSPTATGLFVNGVWTGEVTVHEVVSNLVLWADGGAGHIGESNPFDVQGLATPPVIVTDDGQMGMSGGGFGFNVTGPVGEAVVLEVSTNLLDWLPLQTNILGGVPWYFSDPDTTSFNHRFYRAVTP